MSKYAVGDWMHSNGCIPNTFWRISKVTELNGLPAYDVSYMLNEFLDKEFRHFGDSSRIRERDLRPVTDPRNILLCLLSELREKHDKILQEVDQLTRDIDAVVRVRQLLLCHGE